MERIILAIAFNGEIEAMSWRVVWRRMLLSAMAVSAIGCGGCARFMENDVGFDPARTPVMPQMRGENQDDPGIGASEKSREIERNLGFW